MKIKLEKVKVRRINTSLFKTGAGKHRKSNKALRRAENSKHLSLG